MFEHKGNQDAHSFFENLSPKLIQNLFNKQTKERYLDGKNQLQDYDITFFHSVRIQYTNFLVKIFQF